MAYGLQLSSSQNISASSVQDSLFFQIMAKSAYLQFVNIHHHCNTVTKELKTDLDKNVCKIKMASFLIFRQSWKKINAEIGEGGRGGGGEYCENIAQSKILRKYCSIKIAKIQKSCSIDTFFRTDGDIF